MFDLVSDNLAYWLYTKNLIKEKHFETVSLIFGTVLFAIVSTSLFLLIGTVIMGSMWEAIRVMLVFNIAYNIMNFKLKFHCRYEACLAVSMLSLILLFTLSTLATSILSLFLASTKGIILFDIVSTILYIKWFLHPKTRLRIREFEKNILRFTNTEKDIEN